MYIKVSWKEFHCPTAEKMATVARIGVQMGKTIIAFIIHATLGGG